MLRNNNAVIIITCAPSGVGQEPGTQFSRAKARIALCDIQADELNIREEQMEQTPFALLMKRHSTNQFDTR